MLDTHRRAVLPSPGSSAQPISASPSSVPLVLEMITQGPFLWEVPPAFLIRAGLELHVPFFLGLAMVTISHSFRFHTFSFSCL